MDSIEHMRPKSAVAKNLNDLADVISAELIGDPETLVYGISLASHKLLTGDIFAALPGRHQHGANFLASAVLRGAVAVLTDTEGYKILKQTDINISVLVTENPRRASAFLAKELYRPAFPMPKLLGVTGTNGKTMTVYLIDAIVGLLGKTSAISTTAQRKIRDRIIVSDLTTPEACDLHAMLAVMAEEHVDFGLIEVSAQAHTHGRVAGIEFDSMSFLNLSHDHLDDYPDFEDYYQAKFELFQSETSKSAVIALDTVWGERLAQEVSIPTVTLSSNESQCETITTERSAVHKGTSAWTLDIISQTMTESRFRLRNDEEGLELEARLGFFGEQIIWDTAIAILQLLQAGVKFNDLRHALQDSVIPWNIPGRMQRLSGREGPTFFLDYGHTPEAFRSTLASLKSVFTGKIVMLFGADGDRDPSKRELMAKYAAQYAQAVVITDYNPRFEDAAAIRATLMDGVREYYPNREVYEIQDQAAAVRQAISIAGADGLVLWSGPGHEEYREVQGRQEPYSAREDALLALKEAGWRV